VPHAHPEVISNLADVDQPRQLNVFRTRACPLLINGAGLAWRRGSRVACRPAGTRSVPAARFSAFRPRTVKGRHGDESATFRSATSSPRSAADRRSWLRTATVTHQRSNTPRAKSLVSAGLASLGAVRVSAGGGCGPASVFPGHPISGVVDIGYRRFSLQGTPAGSPAGSRQRSDRADCTVIHNPARRCRHGTAVERQGG
jgi:hypothetical protein